MKHQAFAKRFLFAFQGICHALKEKSFRTQLVLGAGAFLVLGILQPAPIWWAVLTLTTANVLAFELMNTALEAVVDKLHPEIHPLIGVAKDCAAGAVLLMSFAALMILACLLWASFV